MSVNWNLLENDLVQAACESAAKGVVKQYGEILEYGDALQEAYIAVATHPEKIEEYLKEDGGGYLRRFIWQRVTNVALSMARKRRLDDSLEQLTADWQSFGPYLRANVDEA